MGTFIYDPVKGYTFVMDKPVEPERKTAKIIDFEYWQDRLAIRKLQKPKEKEHVRERTQEGRQVAAEIKPNDA